MNTSIILKLKTRINGDQRSARDEFTRVLGVGSFVMTKKSRRVHIARIGEWEVTRRRDVWSLKHLGWKDARVLDPQTLGAVIRSGTSFIF